MSHELVWSLDRGSVSARLECNDEDCINRYVCVHACETIYDIVRADDGTVSHGQWFQDEETDERHEMTREGECNFALFLNEDPCLIPELFEDDDFEIGRTLVDPVWQGEDGVLWKRAEVTS